MSRALYRMFAWRAFWFWLGAHGLAAVAIALARALADLDPPQPGVGSGVWMVATSATLLYADIARNREQLLLHDLGVRLRVLIPLVLVPILLLEVIVVLVRSNVG